ncbi:hypothetical protein VPNG_04050 [Cytospora leucostoma]|uniref:Uncharacterized protein n=1 Tax=Cytospora leucostoma TaxID=1230097 RepID=A0A423XD89_9PEZI|nr:hypothetical protein VPNG_04050 [Cytospora leucostoma]
MPVLAIASELALPPTSTGAAQQLSAATASPDESNILKIVFSALATLATLLSVAVAYQQLVVARRNSPANSQPVELEDTS